jgi:hypothetical protein
MKNLKKIHKKTQSAHCVVQVLGQRDINNNLFDKNKLVLKKYMLKSSSKNIIQKVKSPNGT